MMPEPTTNTRSLPLGCLLALATAWGCSDTAHDLGVEDGDGGSAGAAGEHSQDPSAGGKETTNSDEGASGGTAGAESENTAGTPLGFFEGYVETTDYDDVKLTITDLTDDGVEGHVVFGEGNPVTGVDPDTGYPPGIAPTDTEIVNPGNPVIDGYQYPIIRSSLSGSRLQFSIRLTDHLNEWCQLQEPVLAAPESDFYLCVPNTGGGVLDNGNCALYPEGEPAVPIDCARMVLCHGSEVSCACTAEGCSAGESFTVDFDITVAATSAEGSVTGTISGPLRLTGTFDADG